MSNVVVERNEGATWVGVDRPQVRNALDRATVADRDDAIRDEAVQGPSGLVIHSTTPGTFVAGANWRLAQLAESDDKAERMGAFLARRNRRREET